MNRNTLKMAADPEPGGGGSSKKKQAAPTPAPVVTPEAVPSEPRSKWDVMYENLVAEKVALGLPANDASNVAREQIRVYKAEEAKAKA